MDFSGVVVKILDHLDVDFLDVNILDDPEMRQGIKKNLVIGQHYRNCT